MVMPGQVAKQHIRTQQAAVSAIPLWWQYFHFRTSLTVAVWRDFVAMATQAACSHAVSCLVCYFV